MIVNLRHGYGGLDFRDDDDARSRYELECRRIRRTLPAGTYQVAPRQHVGTVRGRGIQPGATVSARDFDGGDNHPPGWEVLRELVNAGFVLESSQTSDDERAELAEHAANMRRMQEAGHGQTAVSAIDRLRADLTEAK